MRRLRQAFCGVAIAALSCAIPLLAQSGAAGGEWRSYGGDEGSTRYSPLDQIDRENVKELKIAWTWKSDNFGRAEFKNESTPIMANGVLYFTAGDRRAVVAVDALNGETLWLWRMDEGERHQRAPRRNSGRGVAYWADGQDERIVVITPGFRIVALNARTGIPVPGFGENGIVDLFEEYQYTEDLTGRIGNTSPAVIARNTIVVGPALLVGARVSKENVKADIMAFDVRTGRRKWVVHTIPRKGEAGYETWLNDSAEYTGNAGMWGPYSVDPELGYVYLSIEAPTNDVYGGDRPGANLFSDSLMCVDIETGKVVWYRQLIHHDIWDYDLPPHPILVDITVGGRPVRAVVQLSKQAFAYVFDRVTGAPVWPIEERPVPASDVPGELAFPTQPFPTRPPPFDVQGITTSDLIDFTPELRAKAIEAIKPFRTGPLYTPGSLGQAPAGTRGTIIVPGFGGGANWESGAADPETGFVYVGSSTGPSVIALTPPQPNTQTSSYVSGGGLTLPRIDGLPLMKPPYGRITAYDMNRGEIAWQIANGDTPPAIRNNPALQGLTIPRTGSQSRAGILVTKTLLFAGEGWGGQPVFRAYDKATGQIIWETQIPAGTQTSLPMTYVHQGRQFIAFMAGDAGTSTPAQLVAFALPPPPASAPAGAPPNPGGGQ
jgi:quinoprotein glucose dehydrogenase